MATMEPPLVKVFMHEVMLPEDRRNEAVAQEGRKEFKRVGRVLEDALEGHDFIVGDRFTVADLMLASMAGWAGSLGMLEDFPGIKAYSKRLAERPAYQRANAD